MRQKWFQGAIFFLAFLCVLCTATVPGSEAGERLNRILADKVLKVGTPGDYRPFAMLTDGKYEGHDVDMVELMAKDLGVVVEYVPTSWPKLMEDYLADRFDVALGGISRNVARMAKADFLPPYAPSGKVALVRMKDKDRFKTQESLNQKGIHVIKNPGGTNEKYVDAHLKLCTVTTHEKNAEIPALIAEGKGDVMITDTYEALLYAKQDERLCALFVEKPLTPLDHKGFMLQIDDPDFVRMMNFLWDTLRLRGEVERCAQKWLE